MRRHDRLAQLAACHRHLRYHGLATIDAYRSATRSQLAPLSPRFRTTIRQNVQNDHPDVLRALRPPGDVTCLVAGLTYHSTARTSACHDAANFFDPRPYCSAIDIGIGWASSHRCGDE